MKKWLKITLTIIIMVALTVALYLVGFKGDWIRPLVENIGIWGYIVFFLLQVIITTVLCFVPATTFTFTILAVQVFGLWGGFIIAFLGCWVSSQLMFFVGRYGGVKFVDWLIGEKDRIKIQNAISDRSTVLAPALLIIPFTPDDAIACICGMTKMTYRYYAIMTIFARVSNVFLTAFFGSGSTWNYIITALNGNVILWIMFVNLILVDIWLIWKFSGWIEKKLKQKRECKNMSDEIWKPVLGNELYSVSSFGRLKNVETNHILKQTKHNNYMTIKLKTSNGYKPFLVHRIVAKAFIPNPKNLPQINHKDENGTNNHIENLEWCSAKYNANYGHRNEKNSTKVICLETGEIFPSMQKCAEFYKCSAGGISTACAKKGRYTVKGLHFCLFKDKDNTTIEDIEKIRFDKIHHIKAHREKKEKVDE